MTEAAYRRGLAERLRKARGYAGFTQEDVARALGMNRSVLSHIETGSRGVDASELARFARLYMVPPEDLLMGPKEGDATWMAPLLKVVEPLDASDRSEVLDFARYLHARRRAKEAQHAK